MMRTFFKLSVALGVVAGCAGGPSANPSSCAQVKSVIRSDSITDPLILEAPAGLLISTHRTAEDERVPMSDETTLSQCTVSMDLIDKDKGKIRLWTASHCIRRLTITSMTLAVRDKAAATGGYIKWNLQHDILDSAKKMQDAYVQFGNTDYNAERIRLRRAWDRRKMTFVGDNSTLTPRVSCENLRWSQAQADSRHSLCFSIFDLMSFDIIIPEKDSTNSRALLDSLARHKSNSNTHSRINEKRSTFLRRIDVASQSEWIIHESNMIATWMKGFSQAAIPRFADIVVVIENLNRKVFSLPHPEESSFMTPSAVQTQDAPVGQNVTLQVIHQGTYRSPRTTADSNKDIDGVGVICHRQLRKYNAQTGKVDTLPELELRPHEYCAGGAKEQIDHFWIRTRQWSEMMADLTLTAAQDYSLAIKNELLTSLSSAEQMGRLSLVSNFENEDTIQFETPESSVVSSFLRHFMLPVKFITNDLGGLQNFDKTGAILFSVPRTEARARFQKGDSGAILLLDGVPIATLYSVDGEETSGGASIRSLPEVSEEEASEVNTATPAAIRKGSLSAGNCAK